MYADTHARLPEIAQLKSVGLRLRLSADVRGVTLD